MPTKSSAPPTTPIYWMAVGTFAIGTEGFMIAPLLPRLAGDLKVSVAEAGQLVTVFALTYALSSPILTALTGALNRRRLLVFSMIGFAAANGVAFVARDYWMLMGARVLLAVAAGLYSPNANALAGALVSAERRGSALAIVSGGTSIAVALGVPLGSMVGARFGWRAMFVGVGVLALIATLGLLAGLARDVGSKLHVTTLRERIGVIRQPGVLRTLLVTTLWATGAYTVYTYIATFLHVTAGIEGASLSAVLFVWGLSAAIGIFAGGTLTDRHGPQPVIVLGSRPHGAGVRKPLDQRGAPHQGRRDRAGDGRDRRLGPVGLGLLSGSADPADRRRRDQGRADRALAQRLLHVPGLLARRCARLRDFDLRRAFRARLGWRALRTRIASALDPNNARDCCDAGARSSTMNRVVEP